LSFANPDWLLFHYLDLTATPKLPDAQAV